MPALAPPDLEIAELLANSASPRVRDDLCRMAVFSWLSSDLQRRLVGPVGLAMNADCFRRHGARFIDGNRVWIRGSDFHIKLRHYLLGLLHLAGFAIDQAHLRDTRSSRILRLFRRQTSTTEQLADVIDGQLSRLDRASIAATDCLLNIRGATESHVQRSLIDDPTGHRRAMVQSRKHGLAFLDGRTMVQHGEPYERRFAELIGELLRRAGILTT